MQRHLIYIIIGICLALTSCSLHMSHNGDLDGFWQLRSIENKVQGTAEDMRESQISWSFQGSILEMRNQRMFPLDGWDVIESFRLESGELILFSPYLSKREEGDVPVEDATLLNVYGVYQTEEHFKVLELNDEHMVLESAIVRLSFRKY